MDLSSQGEDKVVNFGFSVILVGLGSELAMRLLRDSYLSYAASAPTDCCISLPGIFVMQSDTQRGQYGAPC